MTLTHVVAYTPTASREGAGQMFYTTKTDPKALKAGASFATSCIPYVGDVKDIQEAATGKDLITGEKLSGVDRVLTITAAGLPVVSGPMLKSVKEGGTIAVKKAPDVVKGAEKLIKKNAPKVKKAVKNTDVAEDTAKAMKKKAVDKVKNTKKPKKLLENQEVLGVGKAGNLTVDEVGSVTGNRKILGSHYDTILEKHKQNPEFFAHPDNYKIVEGSEYSRKRAEYTRMVNNGELEPGHHILGIADGGMNVQSNITPTGEKFISRNGLPEMALEYYDSVFGSPSNPHPKRIAVFEENGKVKFGKNPLHTEATTLQKNIHDWQKANGYRRK